MIVISFMKELKLQWSIQMTYLTEITVINPRKLFSLEFFKGYTLSCFKGNINICYNDLINSFTQKLEIIPQHQ